MYYTRQTRLFGEDDLPLFSGTPMRGEVEAFAPQPIPDAQQSELFTPEDQDQTQGPR